MIGGIVGALFAGVSSGWLASQGFVAPIVVPVTAGIGATVGAILASKMGTKSRMPIQRA